MEFVQYKIGDVVTSIKTGRTPNTKEQLYYDGNIPWVTPSDLIGQQYIEKTENSISQLALADKEAVIYEQNTVLVSCIGDIGKTAIVKTLVSSNQQITGLQINQDILHPKFFYYWVIKNKELLSFKANKVVIAMLNNKRLLQIPINIPKDLEYQTKVVFQLDTVQQLIDKRIETLRLIDQILRSIFLQMFGDPVLNTHRLKTLFLSDKEFSVTSGITPSRKNADLFDGDIPWVKSTDINKQIIKFTEEKISNKAIELAGAKVYPPNSVMLAMYGQGSTRGKVALLGITASANQACAVINTTEMSPIFLYSCLNYSYEYLRSLGKGGNRENLSLTELKKIRIISPSKLDQLKFENIFKEIKKIEELLINSLDNLKTLFLAFLENAFNANIEIDEESIFKDLVKNYQVSDFKGNRNRLQYLINLIASNEFDSVDEYTIAKNKLFELILEGEIEQKTFNDKISLQVK